MVNDFLTWFKAYSAQALSKKERRLILLEGSEVWAAKLLSTISSTDKTWLVYSESHVISSNVGIKQYREKLGSESDYITFVCPPVLAQSAVSSPDPIESQFNADAFAALSGTLVAGGILFLVMPQWKFKDHQSLFLKRLSEFIRQDKSHHVIHESTVEHSEDHVLFPNEDNIVENCSKGSSASLNLQTESEIKYLPYQCKTEDQVAAVNAIHKVVSGHRKRPLVITADRGRGKSSALAIACSQLLIQANDNPIKIIITSGHLSALSVFFNQLQAGVVDGCLLKNRFSYLGNSVEFVAIDELMYQSIQRRGDANLVIVDEAASIPVHLLKQLLQHNHRMVFSSTVHGYEGAGRGFAIKFKQVLNSICPQWHSLKMHEPMRWRPDDPLEKLIFKSCLLAAQFTKPVFEHNEVTVFQKISKMELADNEALLNEIYAILVTAHYQTKPNDLKLLLDNQSLDCFCLFSSSRNNKCVVAVALVMREGDVNPCFIDQVSQNKRRLKNHFIPQSLLVHSGVEEAFKYQYFRIMRIAVHPQLQAKGIGSHFLECIVNYANLEGIDFVGASFGANSALLSFWLKNNFQLTRIGFKREQSSGEHSAMVIQALSKQAKPLLLKCTTQFHQQFEYLLVDEYKRLSVDLVILVLMYFPKNNKQSLTPLILKDVSDYSSGLRQFSPCVYSLHLWLKNYLVNSDLNDYVLLSRLTSELGFVVQRVMQKHSVNELCQIHQFTGRKSFENALKNQVANMLLSRK